MSLWGGRFEGRLDPAAWRLNASLPVDQRLAEQDVRGSQAWASGLVHAGVITTEEHASIQAGLAEIAKEFAEGVFAFDAGDEDIHSAVERRLGELIGPTAGRLHTGRSRNDQVATDLRLWLLDQIPAMRQHLEGLMTVLLQRAEADMAVVMPGYTHVQRAQPVLLSHWWLSHFWPLVRDRERLTELTRRVAVLPLGSGALAGTPFPIDRQELCTALGFDQPAPNSMDAVADRDFVVEYLFFAALLGVHLSRLSEAVILFCSAEFGFFELSDAYSTGSSLMPQKKNPDVFELARGKSGTMTGLLTGCLTTLKGLPSAYDKDLQEDKQALFSAHDSLISILPVLAGALETMALRTESIQEALDPMLMVTDLADYLVARGIPFRSAHHLAGRVVQKSLQMGLPPNQLPLSEYQSFTPAFAEDVYLVYDPHHSIARRSALGGTARQVVQSQLDTARRILIST